MIRSPKFITLQAGSRSEHNSSETACACCTISLSVLRTKRATSLTTCRRLAISAWWAHSTRGKPLVSKWNAVSWTKWAKCTPSIDLWRARPWLNALTLNSSMYLHLVTSVVLSLIRPMAPWPYPWSTMRRLTLSPSSRTGRTWQLTWATQIRAKDPRTRAKTSPSATSTTTMAHRQASTTKTTAILQVLRVTPVSAETRRWVRIWAALSNIRSIEGSTSLTLQSISSAKSSSLSTWT